MLSLCASLLLLWWCMGLGVIAGKLCAGQLRVTTPLTWRQVRAGMLLALLWPALDPALERWWRRD